MKKKKLIDIPEIIDDNFIILFFIKNNKIIKTRVTNIFLDLYPSVKQYLENRYIDFNSYKETLYRIYNNINEIPLCSYCHNNKTKFYSFTKGYLKHCCSSCAMLDPCVKEKLKNTNLEKYGCEHNWSNKDIRLKCIKTSIKRYGNVNNIEKIKETNLKKYGVEFPYQYKIFLDKSKETTLKHFGVSCIFKKTEYIKQCLINKYGTDNIFRLKEFQEKCKQTMIKRYGSEYALNNNELREKGRETQREKYNGLLYVQTELFKNRLKENINNYLDKCYKTRKLHNSFITSKIEIFFEQYLKEHYINYETLYRTVEYPFKCDFFIKDYNLYIEINAHWSHGIFPFNENIKECLEILKRWKSKNSKFYKNAIETWTIRDKRKILTAIDNKLNYLVIYSNKIDNVISEFENYLTNIKYNLKLSF